MKGLVNLWDFNGSGIFQFENRKKSQTQKEMNFLTIRAVLFLEDKRADRQTDMAKLIADCCNFV
jgi:hypothetical protein